MLRINAMTAREVDSVRAHQTTSSNATCASGGRSDSASTPTSPQDDEATGIDDPFLDELLLADESVDQVIEDGPVADIPIGLPMDPLDLDSVEEGKAGPESPELYAFDDGLKSLPDDDEQGPNGQFQWEDLNASTTADADDPDDGPIENQPLPLEPLRPLGTDNDIDEEPMSAVPLSGLQIDDIELPWAKERWAECSLHVAFSARQSLTLVGSTLCVGGETTHLLHSRDFGAIQDAPLGAKTRRVLCLDTDANRLLLLATTGQLFLWRRNNDTESQPEKIPVPNSEVISMIWQLAPGVPTLLMRLESGRLLEWDDKGEALVHVAQHGSKLRLRALSEVGEPRIALWQDHHHPRLYMEFGQDRRPLALTPSMDRAIADSHPMLAGFLDHVLLGARDHGLFLRGPGGPEFAIVPGCRRLTAFTVGNMLRRPTAFVGLFSELEDRTEIVALDLLTGRANRIAELSVLTDDAGPEDDPPERARIDALLWDPSLMRLWAAGCFGLTCFSPPATAISS